jgi:hypothetical protein
MARCFVIQPFDGGPFDKRYDDVLDPAIRAAGLEPYRVDRDPGASIPIDDIESGIRNARLCLADITVDNPNVWFELGFAIAVPREVVLVCADERQSRFPFDVQHRNIIRYKTEAPQDFTKLQASITERISALLRKHQELAEVSEISPIKDTEGLSQHEIVALVSVMQNSFITEEGVSAWQIRDDMNNAGFTDVAIGLAIKSLRRKRMLHATSQKDRDGAPYSAYALTTDGEEWLLANEGRLVLRRERPKAPPASPSDDVPF